jgi:carboxypeptidase family protein
MPRLTSSAILAVLIALCLTAPLRAQTTGGEATGTVSDSSGGVLPGAAVTLTNQGTKIARTMTTNASGNFVFVNVPPGTYVIQVELSGFQTAQTPPFTIGVNETIARTLTLAVGTVNEAVTVAATAPLLQSASSELGTVIPERVVHDLPLNGRNFTQLLTLTPGATPVSTAQGSSVGFQDAGISGIPGSSFSKPALHGQENRSTLYYLDGIFNTDLRGPVYGVLPIVDLIQEFKVEAHNQNTEFGGVTGGVVNIASKSGSNAFQGSGWEFLRNNNLDARDPFKDATADKPATFRQNEFGGSFGGPIVKNRTFFYTGYEGWRYTKPSQSLGYVPTAAELAGDFTQTILHQDIYNPFSTRPDPTRAGAFIRDRFQCDNLGNPLATIAGGLQPAGTSCNKIPSSLISPQMSALFKAFLAAPNLAGDSAHNYIETRPTSDDSNSWQIKIDHRFNDSDNVFARLSQMFVHHLDPLVGTVEVQPSDYHAYNYGGGWDHVFRSNLLADVRGGVLQKPYVFNQAQGPNGFDPLTAAGFADLPRFQGLIADLTAPWITGDIGNRGPSLRGNPDWSVGGNVTWLKGNHNLKSGASFVSVERLQINTFQQFVFNASQTSNPASAGNTGLSLASALLGLPQSFSGQLADLSEVNFRASGWNAYVQDEWRIRPTFTLNWGLRYDVLMQPKPLNNRLSNAIDIPNQQLLIGADSIPDCKATQQNPCFPGNGFASIPFNSHIVFAGSKPFMPKPVYDNVGPRVGAAWHLDDNTVLRAGYGLFWDALPARSQYTQNDIEGAGWPWTTAFSGTANALGLPPTLQTMSTLVGGFPTPIAAANPWTAVSGAFADDPNYKDGYSNQWNVEVQRELGPRMMFAVAYVGSRNGRLAYTGYANASPTPSPNGTPLATIDAARPVPFMVANIHYTEAIGSSHYNSLQTKFERRLTNGLQTLVSYTWSKSIDNTSGYFGVEDGSGSRSSVQNFFDPQSNEGPSGFDIPQFFSWYTVWELPVGTGKRWLNSGPAAWILGNWSINSIFQARSGQPFNVGVAGDVANIGGTGPAISNYERPNLVGNPIPATQTAAQWFDPTAFAIPSGAFGNFQRNGLRSATVKNVDLSLFKNVPVNGNRVVQLRVEAFNVFNIQNFGVPSGTTIGQAGAGAITSIVGTPRQIQIGARVVF